MTSSSEQTAQGAPATTARPLRRNRNFQLLWTGQVLSDVGTQAGTLAYALLVLDLTHRAAFLSGLVSTVASAAAFAVRLPAGALADRLDQRRAMLACDAVRAALLCALGVGVVLHVITWPVVLVVAVADRVGDTLFSPASMAAVPKIVEDAQLETAFAASEARQHAASLVGPSLGGALYGIGRAVPFLGDALSYGISVATTAGIRGEFGPVKAERRGLWSEAMDGVRLMVREPLLRAVIIQSPLINFAFTGMFFTVILGMRVHGVSSTVIGLTESGIIVGGLAGALLQPRLHRSMTLHQMIVAITLGGCLMMAVASVLMPSPLMAIPLAVPLLLAPTANAGLFAVMLRRTPAELHGRVTNSLLQAATGLAVLAPIVSGVLVQHVSANWAAGTFAATLAVSAVLALTLRSLRDAESPAAPEGAADSA